VTLLKRFGIGITNTVLKLVFHTFLKYQKTPAWVDCSESYGCLWLTEQIFFLLSYNVCRIEEYWEPKTEGMDRLVMCCECSVVVA